MSYATAEVLGRVERRRRFSVEQKLAVLREATAPGASMSAVARRHGLLPAQAPSLPAPVSAEKPTAGARAPRRRRRKKAGLIEIELEGGRRVRVDRDVDAAALERVLDVLARR